MSEPLFDPDTPSFASVADYPKTMTPRALSGSVRRVNNQAHTHEAHPTVWVQTRDPRWTDDDHLVANTALKIGDIWVDNDYALYDGGWGGTSPYTRVFDGDDWREMASGTSSTPKLSYTHVQTVASALWTVTHNLGYRPNVTVVDSAETQIIPGMNYLDENSLELSFTGMTAGKAYCS